MYFLYIILAIVVLLLMVLIHEFGHYCIGRMLNFKITEFSVGFGKALFSRKNKRGELISLRLFPLGGYCAFAGEDEVDKNKADAFTNQKPWKRILVFFAGVSFNFATAVLFSLILLCTVGYDIPQVKGFVTEFNSNIVKNIDENYVPVNNYLDLSEDELLQTGDIIISVNGEKIDFAYGANYSELVSKELNNLVNYMKDYSDSTDSEQITQAFLNYPTVNAVVTRNGQYKNVKIGFWQVRVNKTDENGNILAGQYSYKYVYNVQAKAYVYTFGEALQRAVPFAFGLAFIVLKSFWLLITFQLPISSIGGPLTTISQIATFTQQNAMNLLVLIPLISANLAVFNVLPIPALDGAHVLFTTIEAIRKKPIKRETENLIHTIGLLVLFGLVVIIDILHFVL